MGFFGEYWGDLSSVAGFILALIGLGYAGFQSRKARSSAEAAEEAAKEATEATRKAIGRNMLTRDLERSIHLIEQLKALHRDDSLDAALVQYTRIKEILSAIIARYPVNEPELSEQLSEARTSIAEMEEYVESHSHLGSKLDGVELSPQLNIIQRQLQDMANTLELGGEMEGGRYE